MNTPQTRRLTILNVDEIEAIFGLPQFTEDERQVRFALSLRIPRDGGHDSMVMADSVPASSRTAFHGEGGHLRRCSE